MRTPRAAIYLTEALQGLQQSALKNFAQVSRLIFMPQDLEQIRRYMGGDQFANRNGIELVSVAPGSACAKMPLQSYHWNGLGTVMGGAIFTLADFAFAAASNAHGTVAVAINVNISFVKASRTGTLWAEARELSRNPKLATYTVDVKDDAGDLVAVFQGMVYRKKELIG